MNVLDLKSVLNSEVKNVYVITGNDSFLRNVAVTQLKEALVDGFEEFNYVKLDGESLKESDYNLALNTLPFGAGNRLIIINNINNVGASVINDFSKLPFFNVVVAVVEPSQKINGEEINCDHLIKFFFLKIVF